jgi:hypothetical protein
VLWVTLLKFQAVFVLLRDLYFSHRVKAPTHQTLPFTATRSGAGVANESVGEPLAGAFFVLVNGFLHETEKQNIYSVAALLTSFLPLALSTPSNGNFGARLSAVLAHHAGCIPGVITLPLTFYF